MSKSPFLIVVTGRPASGKTTLAKILSQKINCPLLSRDEFKEGYINTVGLNHAELDSKVNWHIYEIFFQAADLLISNNISIIVEAAFQHKLWQPKLSYFLSRASVRIIICTIQPELAETRFINRYTNDPGREKFHGDKSLDLSKEENIFLTDSYQPPKLFAPTLEVNTTNSYNPGIKKIIEFIKQ